MSSPLAVREIEGGGGEAGDGALHVGSAPSVKRAVLDDPGEGRIGPQALIAGRHHVGMPGEADMRRPRADAGEEIVDRRRAVLGESEPPAVEAAFGQGAAPARRARRHLPASRSGSGSSLSQAQPDFRSARSWRGTLLLADLYSRLARRQRESDGAALELRVVPRRAERVRAEAVRAFVPRRKPISTNSQTEMAKAASSRRPRAHTTSSPCSFGTAMATTIRITATAMTRICHREPPAAAVPVMQPLTLSAKAIQALTRPMTEMAEAQDTSRLEMMGHRVDDRFAGGPCDGFEDRRRACCEARGKARHPPRLAIDAALEAEQKLGKGHGSCVNP